MTYNMWGDQPTTSNPNGEKVNEDFQLNREQLNAKYPRPLVAFDRDGVMFETDGNPILSRESARPIKESFIALAKLRHRGFKIAMIHDQPGISAGLVTHEQVDDINNYVIELLGQYNCPSIDGILYNESNHKSDMFGKPKVGMFRRLRDEFNVPYKNGYYVGDQVMDAKMAMKAGLLPVLVRSEVSNLSKLDSFANKALKNRTLVYDTFLDFADTLF